MIDFEEDILEPVGSGEFAPRNEAGLWVTKYRPRTLEHFCLDEKLKNMFQKQIEANDVQNVCLIGGPGIGKTTLALILANAEKDSDILFVSCASGEGKVETIQSKIVPFCQAASRGRKFVILDELDSASATQANSFQKALRNVVEAYPDCRFLATANYQSNVIGPLCPSRLPPVSLSFSVSEMISNLLYIEAVGNYVKVCQWRDGKLQSDMLRATSKQIESELQAYPMVVRCHRAFLVNLTQVEQIVSHSGSMQLHIRHSHEFIPVSRSNMSQVKEGLTSSS